MTWRDVEIVVDDDGRRREADPGPSLEEAMEIAGDAIPRIPDPRPFRETLGRRHAVRR